MTAEKRQLKLAESKIQIQLRFGMIEEGEKKDWMRTALGCSIEILMFTLELGIFQKEVFLKAVSQANEETFSHRPYEWRRDLYMLNKLLVEPLSDQF